MTEPSSVVPPRRRHGPRRPVAAPLAFAVAAMAAMALVLGAAPASAHSDDGKFEVVSATPAGTSSTITVKLLYTDDDPVTDATVTVAGDNGAGASLTPVTLRPGSTGGEYTGTVDFPATGTWNLRLTSVKPAAELALTQEIGPGTPVGAAGATPTTASATDPGSSTTNGGGVPQITAKDAPAAADSGTSPVWWIVGGIVVVVAVGLGVLFVARGRNQGPID
jgi:hypothetical protein